MVYNAFISYSHAADGTLAPALQSALHRFAKPWYKLRALHIFRDQTNLAVNPACGPVRGDMGTRGTPEQRVGESEAAGKVMGLTWRGNLHFPDARLENTISARMTLAVKIRELQPRTVTLPYWGRANPTITVAPSSASKPASWPD